MIRGFSRNGSEGISRRAAIAAAVAIAAASVARPANASTGEVRVTLKTALGIIVVAVDPVRAPITAGDFLAYVDRGLFDNTAFYRSVRLNNDHNPVKIEVLQGGLIDNTKMLPPIAHEPTSLTGLRHGNGTLSAGRREPGTGSAGAFFICIGDQPELDYGGHRNPDGQGFAAFGHVISGMDVVRQIWSSKTGPADRGMDAQKLTPPVPILAASRDH